MKAPVRWIVVLRLAIGTHQEGSHRRLGPVVGNILDDREARTAVGAVDERVPVAAVARVEELSQAVIADGNVRGYGLKLAGARLRMADDERVCRWMLNIGQRDISSSELLDSRQGWGIGSQAFDELVEHVWGSDSLDLHARRTVQHPTSEI